jgi:hypothetical protein
MAEMPAQAGKNDEVPLTRRYHWMITIQWAGVHGDLTRTRSGVVVVAPGCTRNGITAEIYGNVTGEAGADAAGATIQFFSPRAGRAVKPPGHPGSSAAALARTARLCCAPATAAIAAARVTVGGGGGVTTTGGVGANIAGSKISDWSQFPPVS